jgi:hypothetical protein
LLAAVLLGTARRRQRHQHPIGRRTGSMYDSEWFLVNNPLNRYALSTRNALGEECRGSIDLYLQSIRKSSFKPIESDQFQIGPRTSGRFLAKET